MLSCLAGLLTLFASPSAAAAPQGQARFTWQAVDSPLVVGYKVHWGTQSGQYTESRDVGNTTSVVIDNFVEGVEYFSVISAYGNNGLESGYSEETAFIYDTSDRLLLLEAETGTLAGSMTTGGEANTIWTAPDPAAPDSYLTIPFETPYASDVFIWCRVMAPDADRDALTVSIDNQPEHDYFIYGQSDPTTITYQPDWFWSRIELSPSLPRAYALAAGPHSLRIRFAEAVAIDRIVITTSPDFAPTESLPRTGDFIEVLDHPAGVSLTEGGSATLSARFIATGPLEYQWLKNGTALAEARQPMLKLANIQDTDAGDYTASATTGATTVLTNPATVQILPVAPNTIFRVRHLSVSAQGEVTFLVAGARGSHFGIYASEDLRTWDLLATVPNTGETLTVNDSAATNATRRFYRLADLSTP